MHLRPEQNLENEPNKKRIGSSGVCSELHERYFGGANLVLKKISAFGNRITAELCSFDRLGKRRWNRRGKNVLRIRSVTSSSMIAPFPSDAIASLKGSMSS